MKDVNDVLTSIDYAIEMGLANPSKISVLGGSHGGFLTTHLIGQVLKLVHLVHIIIHHYTIISGYLSVL